MKPGTEAVTVTSGYGANTKLPFVSIQIGDRKPFQLVPEEARRVAALLYECADAAESDAFLVSWLTTRIGADLAQAATILAEFRAWRAAQEKADDDAS